MASEKFDLCGLVKEQILHIISQKDFLTNTKLPSENQLALKLQVSRSTIRAVLANLENEGKVFRQHGSGTYVNPFAFSLDVTLSPKVYYTELIRRSGYSPSIEILNVGTIRAGEIGPKLGLTPEDTVIEVKLIYKANDKLCIYCRNFLSGEHATDENLHTLGHEAVSIYIFLSQHLGISVKWDITKLIAVNGMDVKELASLADSTSKSFKPFLLLESISYNQNNEPVMYSHSYVDTDLIKYHLVRRLYADENPCEAGL